jgi:hypothetical protein
MVMAGPMALNQGGFNMLGRLAVFVDPNSPSAIAAISTATRNETKLCHCISETNTTNRCPSIVGVNTTFLGGVNREIRPGKLLWGVVVVMFNFQKLMDESGILRQVKNYEMSENCGL